VTASGWSRIRIGYLWAISTHVRHVTLDDDREAVHELHEPSSPQA
jgi:hypothetical protein